MTMNPSAIQPVAAAILGGAQPAGASRALVDGIGDTFARLFNDRLDVAQVNFLQRDQGHGTQSPGYRPGIDARGQCFALTLPVVSIEGCDGRTRGMQG